MDDFFSSSRGPGVIGMLLGFVVLAGFAGLGLAVFDGSLNGDDASSLTAKLETQMAEIRRLEGTAEQLDLAIERERKHSALESEVDALQIRLRILGESTAEVEAEVEAAREAVESARAEQRNYRQDYRDAVRAKAVGEELERLETVGGTVYESVVISEISPLGLSIKHANGIKRIPAEELPAEMQDYYQFGAEEAEEHQAMEDDRNKVTDEDIAKAALMRKIEAIRAEIRGKTKELRDAEQDIARLQSGIASAQSQIAAEERKAAEYRRMHAEASARGNISSHLAKAKEADRRADQIRGQIRKANTQISEGRQSLRTIPAQISDLEKKLPDLEQQLRDPMC